MRDVPLFLLFVALLTCCARLEPGATNTPKLAAATCRTSDLQLSLGDRFSEPTGQHTLPMTLTNRSQISCQLFGYPTVILVDGAGQDLPFDYKPGGDQVVTSRAPTPVVLAPAGTAFVTVNKYRCDLGDRGIAASVRLNPPHDPAPLSVAIPADWASLAYCGPGDPGSTVFISPIGATVRDTLAD